MKVVPKKSLKALPKPAKARKPPPIAGKVSIAHLADSSGRSKTRSSEQRHSRFSNMVGSEPAPVSKIGAIRRGVSAGMVDEMAIYLDAPKATIFAVLNTPGSTAHKAIKDNKALDPAISERVIRIADITRLAEETFGGKDDAVSWLKRENRALAGMSPLSMLDTGPGADEVRKILIAITYGGVF